MRTSSNANVRRLARMVAAVLIGALLIGACGNSSGTPAGSAPDYWPTTGWRGAPPESQGMDSTQLLGALQYADRAQLNLRTLTVIRNGYIVLDANTQPFNADSGAPVFSVTKSVISLLVGIALHNGSLTNVNETAVSFSQTGPSPILVPIKTPSPSRIC